MPAFKDFTSQRFGKLLVVSRTPSRGKGGFWNVKCDCGTEKVVASARLATGLKSCGCAIAESNSRRTKHGATAGKRTERVCSKAYHMWRGIKSRCFNPNAPHYHRYGGRGITMHAPWVEDFARFLADVGEQPAPGMTLDRVDNDGNYEPGNVRWATRREQSNNRENNIRLTSGGETLTLSQWADKLGLPYKLLASRWKSGKRDPAVVLSLETGARNTLATYNGEIKTLRKWAEDTGVPYETLWWRHKNNKPLL